MHPSIPLIFDRKGYGHYIKMAALGALACVAHYLGVDELLWLRTVSRWLRTASTEVLGVELGWRPWTFQVARIGPGADPAADCARLRRLCAALGWPDRPAFSLQLVMDAADTQFAPLYCSVDGLDVGITICRAAPLPAAAPLPLPHLVELNISGWDDADAALASLAALTGDAPRLATVAFTCGYLKQPASAAAAFAALGRCPALTSLDLAQNSMRGESLELLGGLPRLTRLGLAANHVGVGAGGSLLAGALGGLPRLTRLDLGANGLRADGLAAIAPALARLPLVHLDLGANDLGDEESRELLAETVSRLTGLTWLDLSANDLFAEGADALRLGTMTGLTWLDLWGNGIPAGWAPTGLPWLSPLDFEGGNWGGAPAAGASRGLYYI